MRRTSLTLLASFFLVSTLTGCALFKKKDAQAQDAYDPALETAATSPTNYPVYQPAATDTYGSPGTSAYGSAPRYHIVAKKDTLYGIARMYYNGDQSRWKDIYEANRAEISDPNKIRIGQRLLIP